MSDSTFYREKSEQYLAQNESKVLFWIKQKTEVGPQKKILLRICDATKFGQNLNGFSFSSGQFYTTLWKTALKMFAPNAIEIFGSVNPLPYLVYILNDLDKETLNQFLHKVRQVSVIQTDVQIEELEIFLNLIPNLEFFTISDVVFGSKELNRIMCCLQKTQIQSLAFCPTQLILNSVASCEELLLQVVHFCSGKGAKVADLETLTYKFSATTLLYIQETAFEEAFDAEEANEEGPEEEEDLKTLEALKNSYKLLQLARRIFPVIQTLIFDWNIVEPYTDATVKTIEELVKWLKEGLLERVAIPIYCPYTGILTTITKMEKQFNENDLFAQTFRYATNEGAAPNFALLLITKEKLEVLDTNSVDFRLHQIFVTDRYTVIDDLALLVYIANGNMETFKQFYATRKNTMSIDFGGFNNSLVDEKYRLRQS